MEFRGLFAAARKGETSKVLEQLELLQTREERAWYSGVALIYAAWKGHVQTVIALCDWGVDVNFTDNAGQTAIMYAAPWDDGEIVKILLERGANTQIKDNEGKTVTDYALLNQHKERIIALLSN